MNLQILHLKLLTTLQGSIVPNSWGKSTHVMIPKTKGYLHVNKLRTIQIIEAELNIMLKFIVNKNLMFLNTTSNIIGPNTYGSLKNRSKNDSLLQQNFTLKIINKLKQPSRIISLDSSKFYDRIYPNLSSITMQRLGLHKKISIILSQTLIHTQHRIKTSYGLSTNYIQNNTNQIASGVGKGNS